MIGPFGRAGTSAELILGGAMTRIAGGRPGRSRILIAGKSKPGVPAFADENSSTRRGPKPWGAGRLSLLTKQGRRAWIGLYDPGGGAKMQVRCGGVSGPGFRGPGHWHRQNDLSSEGSNSA